MRAFIYMVLLLAIAGCFKKPPGADAPVGMGPNAVSGTQVDILLGAAAKRLCSSMFVSHRSRESVFADELNDVNAAQMTFVIDNDIIEAQVLNRTARALYRPGLGCTLAYGVPVEQLQAQFDPAAYPTVEKGEGEWPVGDTVRAPAALADVDMAKVDRAIDAAFQDLSNEHQVNTRAVVVVLNGRIIAERYQAPFDESTPQLGWSMTKTVTNALTGILVAEQKLDVAASAPVEEWALDERRQITLGNLLQMSSGLQFSEVYTAGSMSDVVLMLYASSDFGAFTAGKPATAPPDTSWYYSSGTTNVVSRIHRQLFPTQQAYFNFPRERLFNKLGMASAVIEPDASGVFVGSSYMYATPRDWAKIGLLFLNDGVWQGERILPPGWVDYSLTAANAAPQGNYGAQLWLNRGTLPDGSDRPQQTLPDAMFYLSGFEGQNVVVVPEAALVVVRMGLTRSGPRPIWRLVRGVLDAIQRAPHALPQTLSQPLSQPLSQTLTRDDNHGL